MQCLVCQAHSCSFSNKYRIIDGAPSPPSTSQKCHSYQVAPWDSTGMGLEGHPRLEGILVEESRICSRFGAQDFHLNVLDELSRNIPENSVCLPPDPRSRKCQYFLPQQSYSRKYFSRGGGGGRARANLTKCFFPALQPALTFIFSLSLQDHSSHFPWGTSINFNLSGTCRSLSQILPHLGEIFRTSMGKGEKGRRCSGLKGQGGFEIS